MIPVVPRLGGPHHFPVVARIETWQARCHATLGGVLVEGRNVMQERCKYRVVSIQCVDVYADTSSEALQVAGDYYYGRVDDEPGVVLVSGYDPDYVPEGGGWFDAVMSSEWSPVNDPF